GEGPDVPSCVVVHVEQPVAVRIVDEVESRKNVERPRWSRSRKSIAPLAVIVGGQIRAGSWIARNRDGVDGLAVEGEIDSGYSRARAPHIGHQDGLRAGGVGQWPHDKNVEILRVGVAEAGERH